MVTSWLFLVLYSLIQGYKCAEVAFYGDLYGEIKYMSYCLANKEPIQLEDPFPVADFESEAFYQMSWFFNMINGSVHADVQVLAIVNYERNFTFNTKRHKLYKTWGIQIPDPQPSDSGQYTAHLLSRRGVFKSITHVSEAKPPVPETSKLLELRMVSIEGGNWTLKCGKLASIGEPPVDIYWLARNGSTIPGVYKDGNFILFLNEDEDPWGFKCRVNKSSPAIQCMPEEDRDIWKSDKEKKANIKPLAQELMKLLLIIISFSVFIVVLADIFIIAYRIYNEINSTQK